MKSGLLLFLIFVLMFSCTTVSLMRHPDYNFQPTNPDYIRVYTRDLWPTQPYIIIGTMKIDPNWTLSIKELERKTNAKAASIGGNAVIITDITVNILAFNSYARTDGQVNFNRNSLEFYAVRRQSSSYVPLTYLHGYVIRFIN